MREDVGVLGVECEVVGWREEERRRNIVVGDEVDELGGVEWVERVIVRVGIDRGRDEVGDG